MIVYVIYRWRRTRLAPQGEWVEHDRRTSLAQANFIREQLHAQGKNAKVRME